MASQASTTTIATPIENRPSVRLPSCHISRALGLTRWLGSRSVTEFSMPRI